MPVDERVSRALKAVVRGDPTDRLVLLGAGASVEAGMPDGRGLAEALVATGAVPTLETVLASLATESGYPDIERAFSVLEALADLAREDSFVSDLKRARLLRTGLTDPSVAANELDVIARTLRNRLWLVDGLGVGVSAALLGKPYQEPEAARYMVPLVRSCLGGTIATLNYDNVVEQAGGPAVLVRNISTRRIIVPDEQPTKVRLLKLHGSLDWRRVADDVIAGGRPLETEHYMPAVVFGAANKLRHYGPFLELLRAFVNKLGEIHHLFLIGYGFRDQHINEMLRIWATAPAADGDIKRITICQGPGATRLPAMVEPWLAHDHVLIQPLVSLPASDTIAKLFRS
jgi:hypothetical protein